MGPRTLAGLWGLAFASMVYLLFGGAAWFRVVCGIVVVAYVALMGMLIVGGHDPMWKFAVTCLALFVVASLVLVGLRRRAGPWS